MCPKNPDDRYVGAVRQIYISIDRYVCVDIYIPNQCRDARVVVAMQSDRRGVIYPSGCSLLEGMLFIIDSSSGC